MCPRGALQRARLERPSARGANFPFGDRYVVVNLPSTSVEAIENGRVAHRYVAIVGDPEHPSPEIAAHIQVINLNPTWTVPISIIKKEIIPRMQRDPGYLTRAKIRILDGSGQEINPKAVNWSTERAANYTLRQDSGAGNSLGSIRIGMPNKLAVYMHDTPSKRPVRRRLPVPEPRLRPRAGRLRLRRMAACRAPAAARPAAGTRRR